MSEFEDNYREEFENVKAYLVDHKIDHTINEIINETLKIRPQDPYFHMSNLLKKVSGNSKGIRSITAREIFSR